MRLLYDSVLPQSLTDEVPPEVVLIRWSLGASDDAELVREALRQNCRAVVLFERDSLQQPGLRRAAADAGIALVAVEANDPVEAKQRLIRNMRSLREKLSDHDSLLVLASEVRPMSPLSEDVPEV